MIRPVHRNDATSEPTFECFVGRPDYARMYDSYRLPYSHFAIVKFAQELNLTKGTSVLEVGAGSGRLTRALVEFGVEVTCVEPDAGMMGALRDRYGCDSRMHLIEARLEDVELAESAYDVVVAGQSWHLIDRSKAMPLLLWALRPGGSLGFIWQSFPDLVLESGELVSLLPPTSRGHLDMPGAPTTFQSPFGPPNRKAFVSDVHLRLDEVVGLLGTYVESSEMDSELLDRWVRGKLAALWGSDTEARRCRVRTQMNLVATVGNEHRTRGSLH